MILQKDLKIYRFNNIKPNGGKSYDYQLFRNGKFLINILSDDLCERAKVVLGGGRSSMTLVKRLSDIDDRDLQNEDTFILSVIS